MFSKFLKYIIEKLHFFKIVIARFFIILFRRKKEIELLHFDYSNDHIFNNSYIVIEYRFRNAIYYKFGNHKTLEKQIKIFDLQNFDNEFQLTIYGFFRKKTYNLKFVPKLNFETSNFKANLSNFKNDLEFKTIPNLSPQPLKIKFFEFEIKPSKLKLTTNKLVLKHEKFSQNDFI